VAKLLWRSKIIARVRGQQTLEGMRRAGLNAPGPLSVADRVYIDPTFIWAVSIGPHTTIAHDVRIIAHDAAIKHLTGYTEVMPVIIGEGCYIGAGTIVLPGATVGDGTVIGAGSVVRGNIAAGVVAVGNPARAIGRAGDLRDRHRQLQTCVTCFAWKPASKATTHELEEMQSALDGHGRFYVP